MAENKHTMSDLYQWQSLPLNIKIRMTERRIRDWVSEFGIDGVYVSFSGGKDSTVLLDIARKMYGDEIKAVFFDTGLEYPEIRSFVKSTNNVEVIKPKMSFKQVVEKYGFPFISKEVSESVYGARKYLTSILAERNASTNEKVTGQGVYEKKKTTPSVGKQSLSNPTRGGTIANIENSEELANILNERMVNRKGGANQRLAIMLGMLTKDPKNPVQTKGSIPSKNRSMYSQERYKFFLECPFEISNRCCNVMKKEPAHRYSKETGRYPITAQMASESRLRTQKWIQNGCNAFNAKNPVSNPMSFWTEQDVLLYIKTYNIPIAPVYGDVVIDYEGMGQIDGQMSFVDFMDSEEFDLERPLLKTTGCNRTGCVFCGFGCHLEKGEGRFERLKRTHPKHYKALANIKNNGYNFFEAIDWINEHNGKGEIIKY